MRSQNCELQKLCLDLGVESGDRFAGTQNQYDIGRPAPPPSSATTTSAFCAAAAWRACANVQKVGVIGPVRRGFKTAIESPWEMKLAEMACINCGQCITACPVGALTETDNTAGCVEGPGRSRPSMWWCSPRPLCAPRLGEEFGLPMGTSVTGKMAAALRRLGFDQGV